MIGGDPKGVSEPGKRTKTSLTSTESSVSFAPGLNTKYPESCKKKSLIGFHPGRGFEWARRSKSARFRHEEMKREDERHEALESLTNTRLLIGQRTDV